MSKDTRITRLMLVGVLAAAMATIAVAAERNLFVDNEHMYLWTDPDTGCQYLTRGSSGKVMVPRIASDGKTHMGCKTARRAG